MDTRASEGFHMLNSHPQHGQLIQLSTHGTAHRDHFGQLGDVGVHLVSSPFFNLAVILSVQIKSN